MSVGVYKVTEMFEAALCDYTGAPHAVAVDSCSSALLLSLVHERVAGRTITIPARTYMSVPCAIIHAGARVAFLPPTEGFLTGAYRLGDTVVVDSALRFTAGMYERGTLTCLSFTGPHKRLKLGKAGAVLTDDAEAAAWLRRSRYSGRRECSYHQDSFDMIGWNMYLLPDIAARGLALMAQFYDADGRGVSLPDLTLPYPDLSRFPVYAGAA